MTRFTQFISVGLLSLIFAAGVAGCTTPSSAETQKESVTKQLGKVVIGIRKPKHLKVAMMTGHQMLSGEGPSAQQVDIVACGPAVKALRTQSSLASKVQESLDSDIRIVACGVTIEKLGIDKEAFISDVVVVPNGITELARLQANGYVSIEL